jgi:hypothetical protein
MYKFIYIIYTIEKGSLKENPGPIQPSSLHPPLFKILTNIYSHRKHHVTQYEPSIQPASLPYVHHMEVRVIILLY